MFTRATRVLVLAALGLYLLSAAPDCAFACSCAMPGTPQEAMEQASVVFSGKVLSIKPRQQGQVMSTADPVGVFFEASRFWKGQPSQTLALETAADGASCGYQFQQGMEYIVYGYIDDQGTIHASLCSRTAPLAQAAEDLAALGEGQVAPQPDATSPPSTLPETTVTTTTSPGDRLLMIGAGITVGLLVVLGLVMGVRHYSRSRN